jgi:uncharacterized membrane protein YagU involved in acid resistance
MTAERISQNVFGHELTEHEKQIAGPAVHYGYGTLMGGVYGALAEVVPAVTTGAGCLYGAALWAGGDEVALPLLRLAPPPTRVPASQQLEFLAAHFVYGLTVEGVRRLTRQVM